MALALLLNLAQKNFCLLFQFQGEVFVDILLSRPHNLCDFFFFSIPFLALMNAIYWLWRSGGNVLMCPHKFGFFSLSIPFLSKTNESKLLVNVAKIDLLFYCILSCQRLMKVTYWLMLLTWIYFMFIVLHMTMWMQFIPISLYTTFFPLSIDNETMERRRRR